MFGSTIGERRSALVCNRPTRLGAALALAIVSIATTSLAAAAASDDASPEADQRSGTTRFESDWIYSLDLPEGWQLFSALAEASGTEDLFEGPGGVSARIGGGASQPGDTVESRVAENREGMIADGTCESDESADQPTTLGGEPAIAWSWRCQNSFHAAINTLGQGMRLRLQVNVPLAQEQQAADMLEALRQGFAFRGDGTAPSEMTADLAALDLQLQGTYQNEWHPVELQHATIEAAGLSLDDADLGYLGTWPLGSTARTAVTFEDGRIDLFVGVDGGPLERGWVGTYTLIDDHTIEAVEDPTFFRYGYEFTLQDGVLTIDVVGSDDPFGLVAQTGIYETLPFTRVP